MSRREDDYDDDNPFMHSHWNHPAWQARYRPPPELWRPDLVPAARLTLWYLHPGYAKGYETMLDLLDQHIRRRGESGTITDPRGRWTVALVVLQDAYRLQAVFFCDDIEVERATFVPKS